MHTLTFNIRSYFLRSWGTPSKSVAHHWVRLNAVSPAMSSPSPHRADAEAAFDADFIVDFVVNFNAAAIATSNSHIYQ